MTRTAVRSRARGRSQTVEPSSAFGPIAKAVMDLIERTTDDDTADAAARIIDLIAAAHDAEGKKLENYFNNGHDAGHEAGMEDARNEDRAHALAGLPSDVFEALTRTDPAVRAAAGRIAGRRREAQRAAA